ncbi:MAG: hypothetical protein WBP64_15710 [Nitrososphaeraceae archaeon]
MVERQNCNNEICCDLKLALVLLVFSPENNINARKVHGSCFQQGINYGLNDPFNHGTFSTCGSAYERGFMKGCLSVAGNTVDVCNSAEAAG